MTAIAPGKIIISGEHSVVYGKPALVLAVNRFARASVQAQNSRLISFDLLDFHQSSSFTLQALRELKRRLLKNYHFFLQGQLSIRDVLAKPFELFQFLFITMLDGLQLKLDRGINIQLQSDIPIGCGMGSSAATILSVLRAVTEFFALDFVPDRFYDFGLEAEKLQHGRPSGVDPYISLHGGFVRFQNKQAEKKPLPDLPMYIVNTGTPDSSTGECVSAVRQNFEDSTIWQDFEAVTREMETALSENDLPRTQMLVRENHLLLQSIGVVPERIKQFIEDIVREGGAAKISGAGAIRGDKGGIVLIFSEQPPTTICEKYNYQLLPIRGEETGARIV